MGEFRHIDTEAGECLHLLADRARRTLISVGIPVCDALHQTHQGGTQIEIDTGDDDAGGIYISWSFSADMTSEINDYIRSGQLAHQRVQYSGQVRIAMRDALIAILNATGFLAEPSKDDMRPLALSLQSGIADVEATL